MIAFDRDQLHLNVNHFFNFLLGKHFRLHFLTICLLCMLLQASCLSFIFSNITKQSSTSAHWSWCVIWNALLLDSCMIWSLSIFMSILQCQLSSSLRAALTHFKRAPLLFICINNSWFFMTFIIPKYYQLSCSSPAQLFTPHELQHIRLPYSSPIPRAYSNSCPSHWWCHPAISSSVVPFSPCFQSFSASRSFPVSQFFVSGGQSTGVSASASVLPMNIQEWSPLRLSGWISSNFKGLSRVFSNTTVGKHQFFGAPLSLYSKSHIHTWLLEKPQLWLGGPHK